MASSNSNSGLHNIAVAPIQSNNGQTITGPKNLGSDYSIINHYNSESTNKRTKHEDGIIALNQNQPVSAVVVTLSDGTKKLVAATKYGRDNIDNNGVPKIPRLNRYSSGSGTVRWYKPAQGGNLQIRGFYKLLPDTERPVPGIDANYIVAQKDLSDWGNLTDMAGSGKLGFPVSYYAKSAGQINTKQDLTVENVGKGIDSYTINMWPVWDTKNTTTSITETVNEVEIYFKSQEYYNSFNRDSGSYFLFGDDRLNNPRANWSNKLISSVSFSRISSDSLNKYKETSFKAIPFRKDTNRKKEVIPKFTWDLKQGKKLINYWNQIGIYGFSKDSGSNENHPISYVALSEINTPSYMPVTKLLDTFSADNTHVTKVIPFKDSLLAFTETTTTMFEGRIPEKKQLINSNIGLTDKYSDTAQVVSNSVVIRNSESVYAFVPAPGTEGALSLRVRDIAEQIKPLLKEVEDMGNWKYISSVTRGVEYWLIYSKENKTIIFKYNWSKFAWTIDEYDVELRGARRITDNKVIAHTPNGRIYSLLSDDADKFYNELASTIHKEFMPSSISNSLVNTRVDVTDVHDGDTYKGNLYDKDDTKLPTIQSIRLFGVDTPESSKYNKLTHSWEPTTGFEHKYSIEAYNKLKNIIYGKSLEIDILAGDVYDRIIAKIINVFDITTKQPLNISPEEELLKAGLARVAYIGTADPLYARYKKLEDEAKINKVGIWSTPQNEWLKIFPKATKDLQVISGYHNILSGYPDIELQTYINGDLRDFSGTSQDAIFNGNTHIKRTNKKYSKLQPYLGLTPTKIKYEFELGPRKPSLDTVPSLADATILIGNNSNRIITNQSYLIYINGIKMHNSMYNIPAKAVAISNSSMQTKWLSSISKYEKPSVHKVTKTMYKSADTVNIVLTGYTAQQMFIDSVIFRYTQSDRKNFR